MSTTEELRSIAERFALGGPVDAIAALGAGNVNDTFLVRVAGNEVPDVVLQRLNTHVFRSPELVMRNMLRFSEHVSQRLRRGVPELAGRRWEVPRVCRALRSSDHWVDVNGSFWRAISYIGRSRCHDTIEDAAQAREVGFGLGVFHALISDLPADDLADTLEGFHITPGYLAAYQSTSKASRAAPGPELEYAMAFVQQRQGLASVLEDAKAAGRLRLRPIHGDPKVNNVMMDDASGEAIGLIDLDTVKPGLVHYDIGDCLRSACNPQGEETPDWQDVRFDLPLAAALLQGYGSVARGFLTAADYDHLYDAIRLIAFELGLRFLTDHLAGDVYFKTSHPGHNLNRALVQFRLTESIEEQEAEVRTLIEAIR
jgi:Ser/Thr protein kinase RdoA (MazF antagonist)